MVRCARCGEFIEPGTPRSLGHVDGTERTVYSGPEHRRCNRQTGSISESGRVSGRAELWSIEVLGVGELVERRWQGYFSPPATSAQGPLLSARMSAGG